MTIIANNPAIRVTPLGFDGQPTGEPTMFEGLADVFMVEQEHTPNDDCQWSTRWTEQQVTFHLDPAQAANMINVLHPKPTVTITADLQLFLKQWRKTMHHMARLMRVPPYVVMNNPSCPPPSPAASGYQQRIKARRRRNRK